MHGYNMVCPVSMAEVSEEGKFEGATVMEPHKGAYWGPVTVLDYSSLVGTLIPCLIHKCVRHMLWLAQVGLQMCPSQTTC